ncbi:hypothetical protein AX16_004315 [Volvariella volvacea WC 439]|nr:hypothetical protein AX16_004315 [Volvariella volvacea WC 439]
MSISLTTLDKVLFDAPFTKTRHRTITLTNHNSQPVLFKVKTTSPQYYSASPRVGKLDPKSTLSVRLTKFAALPDSPTTPTKKRDQYLIMSTPISWDERGAPAKDTWQKYQQSADMHFKKLSVVCNSHVPAGGEPISIEPSDSIEFQPMKEHRYRAEFVITNDLNESIAFKIKTTHPDNYAVRPNVGRIEPMGSQKIEVICFACTSKPDPHKFLIMSSVIPQECDILPYDESQILDTISGSSFRQKLYIIRKSETGEPISISTRRVSIRQSEAAGTSSSTTALLDNSTKGNQSNERGLDKQKSWVGKALKKLLR